MQIDSLVEIAVEETETTVDEPWERLFSIKMQTDIDDFYVDKSMKQHRQDDLNNGSLTKSSHSGSKGNPSSIPSGYYHGTCPKFVQVMPDHVLDMCTKKGALQNWGLWLYMTEADAEEVRQIEGEIGQYLNMKQKAKVDQLELMCFVCKKKSQNNAHNIKDCFEITQVTFAGWW